MDINWVNSIIDDLTNSKIELSTTILKVKVLAFKSDNEKLKQWVNNEINGYPDSDVPDYRIVRVGVFANLVQDRGLGSFQTRQNFPLPLEHLSTEIQESLRSSIIKSSIADLEEMIKAEGEYYMHIPPAIYSEFSKVFRNNWKVETAWQGIPKNIIQGVLVKIKAKLIDFLMEISEIMGQGDNITILKDKPIDKIFEKTIGHVTADTVNISIGTENIQAINSGQYSSSNIATGNNISQTINQEIKVDVEDFIKLLEDKLDHIPLNQDDKEDIQIETGRLKAQIQREKPKVSIIQNSLRVIEGILLGVTANALTPPILNALTVLLSKIG